jgi:hypothetical protein
VARLVRGLQFDAPLSQVLEPVCALSGDEVQEYGPAVLGLVRLVIDSTLLVGLSPSAEIHPGDNLHVMRDGLFLGVAVVVEIDEDVAKCEFQADGPARPVAGDLIMAGSEV